MTNAYRVSRYGYRAWQIERLEKDGQWRPFKYPGTVESAASGLVDLALAEFATGPAGDVTAVCDALKALETAVSEAGRLVAVQLERVRETAVFEAN